MKPYLPLALCGALVHCAQAQQVGFALGEAGYSEFSYAQRQHMDLACQTPG